MTVCLLLDSQTFWSLSCARTPPGCWGTQTGRLMGEPAVGTPQGSAWWGRRQVLGAPACGGHGGQACCSRDARALGKRETADGRGLVLGPQVPRCPPACCLGGRDMGFWEPRESQPTPLVLSSPSLRKRVDETISQALWKLKALWCVPQVSYPKLRLGLVTDGDGDSCNCRQPPVFLPTESLRSNSCLNHSTRHIHRLT